MKKRFLALLLVLTMVFSLMPAALAADTLSGSGTEDDPYLLATAADLKAFRDMANAEASSNLCATLTADIDLGGEAWTPFEGPTVGGAYAGTFDGANHTIKGLSVNLTSSKGAGLFGTVCGATIKNLKVEGNVSASSSAFVGGIVGRTQTSATIDSCSFAGTVTSTKKSSSSNATAGIVGKVNKGPVTITNCANTATVNGNGNIAAGILGYGGSNKVTIENCYNTGAISGQWHASGICGSDTLPASKITNCYNSGTITATNGGSYYAGITANFKGTISNSYYANPAADALYNGTPTARPLRRSLLPLPTALRTSSAAPSKRTRLARTTATPSSFGRRAKWCSPTRASS